MNGVGLIMMRRSSASNMAPAQKEKAEEKEYLSARKGTISAPANAQILIPP